MANLGSSTQPFIRIHNLEPFTELRLIVANHDEITTGSGAAPVSVKLLPPLDLKIAESNRPFSEPYGTAEMFGEELVLGREYEIPPGCRTAIYTWGGCKLEIRGYAIQEYESVNLAMKEYVTLSHILNNRRENAVARQHVGPRVLVTGAASSGKSSVCNILINYALRAGWYPIFVELDCRGSTDKPNLQLLPGMVGAFVVQALEVQTPNTPLCYFFGHTEAEDDKIVFKQICRRLGSVVLSKLAIDVEINEWNASKEELSASSRISASGIIINAPYQADNRMLTDIIDAFAIDVVAVLDNPSLKQKLALDFARRNLGASNPASGQFETSVIGLAKQGGVVSVDKERLRQLRSLSYKTYFSNTSAQSINSFRIVASCAKLVTLDSSVSPRLPASARPADYLKKFDDSPEESEIQAVEWSGAPMSLLNTVLGISSADTLEDVHRSNIVDVAFVKNVEERIGSEADNEDEGTSKKLVTPQRQCTLDIFTFASEIAGRYLLVPSDKQLKWWSYTT